MLLEAAGADGVEETERPERVDIAGVFGHLERYLDVRLSTKVVDLCRLNLCDDIDEIGGICQITIMQLELVGSCKGLSCMKG